MLKLRPGQKSDGIFEVGDPNNFYFDILLFSSQIDFASRLVNCESLVLEAQVEAGSKI